MARILDEAVLRGIGAMYQSGVARIGGSPKCWCATDWRTVFFVARTAESRCSHALNPAR
jgi:hypothetical protein